jgi:hypothetical protein
MESKYDWTSKMTAHEYNLLREYCKDKGYVEFEKNLAYKEGESDICYEYGKRIENNVHIRISTYKSNFMHSRTKYYIIEAKLIAFNLNVLGISDKVEIAKCISDVSELITIENLAERAKTLARTAKII